MDTITLYTLALAILIMVFIVSAVDFAEGRRLRSDKRRTEKLSRETAEH